MDTAEDLIGELDLYRSIVEHFPGGLCAFDENLNMTVCNEYLKKLLDYPPELFGGGLPTIEQLFRFKAERGEYGPGDVEQHVRSRLALVAQRQPHRYERQLNDGRIIEVRGRPLKNGGFVTTYLDVTEKRQSNTQFDALINGFPGGIAVFDVGYKMTYCNDTLKNRLPKSDELFANGFPTMEQYIWHNARQGTYGRANLSQTVAHRIRSIRNGRVLKHELQVDEHHFVEVTCIPLKNGGFVETHVDVSFNRLRTNQLEAVVENFPGGLAMFDADLKLVLHNEQYVDLWNYPPELFESKQPTLQELLQFNAQRGEFGDKDPNHCIDERLELARQNTPSSFLQERPDGRTLEINSTPVEGGGFVTTYYDISERLAQEAKSIELAHYSQLTGLPNRTLFQDRLNIALAQAERGTSIALHHVDIHNFKRINDTAGQQTGDKILKILGGRMLETRRETDTFAHLGGDEFAVIQIGIDDLGGAEILARRILRIIREPIEVDGMIFELDACVGISLAPQNGTFFDEIQTKSSSALFNAKQVGPGMIMFYHSCVNRAFV
ncbi:MAG: PAS-domain containing protein [Rhizobiaceae bacterium]